jgi:uncharacterized lipoprotein YmbA
VTSAILYRLSALISAGLLAACAGTPQVSYYTLASPSLHLQTTEGDLAVAIGPLSLPESVDRVQLVLNTGQNRAEVIDQRRWLQPLHGEVAQALAAHLANDLGTTQVTTPAQNRSAVPDVRVAVDFLRFESRLGIESVIEARWTIKRSGAQASASGHAVVREGALGQDFEVLVAAHDRALARIAADIAEMIVTKPTSSGSR